MKRIFVVIAITAMFCLAAASADARVSPCGVDRYLRPMPCAEGQRYPTELADLDEKNARLEKEVEELDVRLRVEDERRRGAERRLRERRGSETESLVVEEGQSSWIAVKNTSGVAAQLLEDGQPLIEPIQPKEIGVYERNPDALSTSVIPDTLALRLGRREIELELADGRVVKARELLIVEKTGASTPFPTVVAPVAPATVAAPPAIVAPVVATPVPAASASATPASSPTATPTATPVTAATPVVPAGGAITAPPAGPAPAPATTTGTRWPWVKSWAWTIGKILAPLLLILLGFGIWTMRPRSHTALVPPTPPIP